MKLKRGKGKRGIMSSTLLYWIIAVTVLAIILIFTVFLKEELFGMADYVKNLFRS